MRRKEFAFEKLERPKPRQEDRDTDRTAVLDGQDTARNPLAAVGNRAVARAFGENVLARWPFPMVGGGQVSAPKMDTAQVELAKSIVIGPLRGAAKELDKGERANVRMVVRHLKPIRTASGAIAWPEDQAADVQSQLESVDDVVLLLDEVKKSHRQVRVDVRHRWKQAAHEIDLALGALAQNAKGDADTAVADASSEQELQAVREQVQASLDDLDETPHTQDGYKGILSMALKVRDALDAVKPANDDGHAHDAAREFQEGIISIVPLATTKEEALRHATTEVNKIADELATVTGEAPPAPDAPDVDDEPDPPPSPAAQTPPAPGDPAKGSPRKTP
jgi:hypothetical protein